MTQSRKIAVLGAGAWGTALAIHLAKVGHNVQLWTHRQEQADELNQQRQNARYLPEIALPKTINISASIDETVSGVDAVLVVVPSQAFRGVMLTLKARLDASKIHIAWATKGFESVTQRLLHEVAYEVFGQASQLSVLSGPTFAKEVAMGLPTAMVSASSRDEQAQFWVDLFQNDVFRMYTQTDILGVEVGGAYKNIMAIATGISDGLNMGANARAALISRGMAEMMRLSEALGGQAETMMGLAGLGDLVLTCTDDLSRNRRFGFGLARGDLSTDEVITEIGQVVEGVKAVRAVKQLAQKMALDLPIMEQVYLLVEGKTTPAKAVADLMARSAKAE